MALILTKGGRSGRVEAAATTNPVPARITAFEDLFADIAAKVTRKTAEDRQAMIWQEAPDRISAGGGPTRMEMIER
ncbi:hypothetical protein [Sphingopyxis sp. YR583]|uniref:hypothetical protein n=1 Tax=Sphingopyxis sp. YR583 TaxID=1881047 RepID=UPI00115FCCFE|nr:hypothetical protein [Sphingopyxis sp. YR583]